MANWTTMYMTPDLAPDEIMLGVRLDIWPPNHGWSFMEYSRRHGDYAIVGVAALVVINSNNCIEKISITLCGIDAAPVRLHAAEKILIDHDASDIAVKKVMIEIENLPDVMEDSLNTADYRRHLAKTMTNRALKTAFERARKRI